MLSDERVKELEDNIGVTDTGMFSTNCETYECPICEDEEEALWTKHLIALRDN